MTKNDYSKPNISWCHGALRVLMGTALLGLLIACKEPGWAKDEELSQLKPAAGQLPPLPSSYFPPPPTSEEEKTPEPTQPPAPAEPSMVTITQVVPPAPAPPPAPERRPVIEIPIPPALLN